MIEASKLRIGRKLVPWVKGVRDSLAATSTRGEQPAPHACGLYRLARLRAIGVRPPDLHTEVNIRVDLLPPYPILLITGVLGLAFGLASRKGGSEPES